MKSRGIPSLQIGQVSSARFLLLISLFVGRCWTVDLKQEHEQNNMSFASSSATTFFSSAVSTLKTGLEAEEKPTQHPTVAVARRMQSNSSRIAKNFAERDLITTTRTRTRRAGLLPKEKLNRYKIEAARQLQASLIHTFQILSRGKLPVKVKVAVKRVLVATQAGNYNPAIVHHLPAIILQGGQQQGQPGKQLETILSTILPQVPAPSKGPLQGLLAFISANLSGVNGLLSSILGGVPDLLSGVINSLTNNLGAVTGALNGTLASLATLLEGTLG